MNIRIRLPITIVRTKHLEEMKRAFEQCKSTIELEKMRLDQCREQLDSYIRQKSENIIKHHICKSCLTLVEPGGGVFGAVGKEESALWREKCWKTKTKSGEM
jgi:hypothetical protein|nr:MAG TPA: hypothetical protein [Caudoviricetes sp.]